MPGNKVLTSCERSVHTRRHTTKLTAEGCHIVVCSLAEAECLQRVRNLFAPWGRTRPNCHSLKDQSLQTAIIKTRNTDTDEQCAYVCSARTAELRVRGSLTQYVGWLHDITNIMVAMCVILQKNTTDRRHQSKGCTRTRNGGCTGGANMECGGGVGVTAVVADHRGHRLNVSRVMCEPWSQL